MSVATTCIALLGLLTVVLGLGVSMQRRKVRLGAGVPDDPTNALHKYSRAHSNTAEYAPIIALLIYILSIKPMPIWLTTIVVLVTFCRFLIVFGLIVPTSLAKPNSARLYGALGTYLFGSALALVLLARGLGLPL